MWLASCACPLCRLPTAHQGWFLIPAAAARCGEVSRHFRKQPPKWRCRFIAAYSVAARSAVAVAATDLYVTAACRHNPGPNRETQPTNRANLGDNTMVKD